MKHRSENALLAM